MGKPWRVRIYYTAPVKGFSETCWLGTAPNGVQATDNAIRWSGVPLNMVQIASARKIGKTYGPLKCTGGSK